MSSREFDEIKREIANLRVQVSENKALILAVARNAGIKSVHINWADSSNLQRLDALEEELSQQSAPRLQ